MLAIGHFSNWQEFFLLDIATSVASVLLSTLHMQAAFIPFPQDRGQHLVAEMEPSDWLSAIAMSTKCPLVVVVRYISAESLHMLQYSANLRGGSM